MNQPASAPVKPNKESRKFRMHPDLLFSVIKSQAGTLNKALLELVMNSVDAGASKVTITLDRKSFSVSDDGKGFTEREQIDSFFETFGQPHVEGDAMFGKFRMGRGQAMSFGKNDWRSGPFRMLVDIKGKGLDYTLETGLEGVQGCQIDGLLYDPIDPSEKRRIEMDLADQCTYTPIPVYLNGQKISKSASGEKWTVENDDAFILVDSSRTMAVYNLGVLVSNFSSNEFGVGGIIVSKRQLDLNFARNDIMRNRCEVWKAIRSELKKHVPKNDDLDKPEKRDESWRQYQAQLMMCLDGKSNEECNAFNYMPLFTDVKGKHWTLDQLRRLHNQMPIVVAPGKSLLADRLHDTKIACVLTRETFSERFRCEIKGVFEYLVSLRETGNRPLGNYIAFHSAAVKVLENIGSFDDVSDLIDSDHQILTAKEIAVDVQCAIDAIKEVDAIIRSAVYQARDGSHDLAARQYKVMKSESAEAFTDGKANIFINIKNLRGHNGPNRGIEWAHFMCSLVLHEYLHDSDSGTGHTHDQDFYHLFHESTFTRYFSSAVARLFREWVKLSEKKMKKIGVVISAQMDLDAKLQDRMGPVTEVDAASITELADA